MILSDFNKLHNRVLEELGLDTDIQTTSSFSKIPEISVKKNLKSYPHLNQKSYLQRPLELFMMHRGENNENSAETEEIKYPENPRRRWQKAMLEAKLHTDYHGNNTEKKDLADEILKEINPKIDGIEKFHGEQLDKEELKLKELFVLAIHRIHPDERDYYIKRLPKVANEPDWTGNYFARIEKAARRKEFLNLKQTYGINEEGVQKAKNNNDQKAISLIFRYAVPEKNPLIWAVKHNLIQMVSFLINRGDDLDATDENGLSALNHAAINQAHNIFNLLKENGAKINFTNNDSNRVFMRYAAQNHSSNNNDTANFSNEFYEEINKQRINWNSLNANGTALIHDIAANGSVEELHKAIELGADINLKASGGITPLMFAVASNNVLLIQELIKLKADLNATDNDGANAAHYAAEYAHSGRGLKLLITNNIDINKCDKEGKSAIHKAAENNNSEIIEVLIKNGINPDLGYGQGKIAALHIAAQKNNVNSIKTLLELGANINLITEDYGYTPLFYAVNYGNHAAINTLLDSKANPNIICKSGRYPIQVAAKDKDTDLVVRLLKAGAKADLTDTNKQNIIHYLAQYSNSQEFIDVIEFLSKELDNGTIPYINNKDNSGKTALHLIAESMNADAIMVMVEAGAQIDIKDNSGSTPIHYASAKGNNEALDELVFNFANPVTKNNRGQTASELAMNDATSLNLYKLGG